MEKKKGQILFGCAVLMAAAVIWAVSGTGFRSGAVIMRIESGGAKSWSLKFDRASEEFVNTHTLRVNGEDLLAEVSLETGEILLTVSQKEKEITFPIGPEGYSAVIPLEGFEKGRLQIRLTSYGAEALKSHFELVEGK